METRISSKNQEVTIGGSRKTVFIGERINPTGKKKMASALASGDLDYVLREARDQVEAGADVLDVNVGTSGVDEVKLLPEVVRLVQQEVDVPLCIDSGNPAALEAALKVYQGKPLVNSVSGEERSLEKVLPVVKDYGAAVIALPLDERGIPRDVETRLTIADKIVERCASLGIPLEDVVFDGLTLSLGVDSRAGVVTLETIRKIKEKYGVNLTLGASNISYGLPGREIINGVFLGVAIAAGVTCPIVDVAKVCASVLAADLILGLDNYGLRYIRYWRRQQQSNAQS
ncbi:MAG: dihydropteroate synthase [Syntrophothermus sp.]|uniref:dihydropteroate synthase n=1 Tax=Syntrophothermus sp. TaxID=2736299 RepID=UPI00257CD997|nr:dihydropteroate synthase [Syntrophothermus sp.]NSW84283.1 dihydropteroate synthase [Syntrophothermus sp.]